MIPLRRHMALDISDWQKSSAGWCGALLTIAAWKKLCNAFMRTYFLSVVNVQVTILIVKLAVCKINMHPPILDNFVAGVWGTEHVILQIHGSCLQNEGIRVCLLNQDFAFSRYMQYHFINPHSGHDHRAQPLLRQLTYADDALSMHPPPPSPSPGTTEG